MIIPEIKDKSLLIITKDYIEKNKYSRPGVDRKSTIGVVMHWTANHRAFATADWTGDYFETIDRYASTQYIIGRDPYVRKTMPADELAYHAGGTMKTYTPLAKSVLTKYKENATININGYNYLSMNNLYIGIEMIPINGLGEYTDDTVDAAIKLAAWMAQLYNWDLDKEETIIRHFDVTGKLCPKLYVDNPDMWKDFKKQVKLLA